MAKGRSAVKVKALAYRRRMSGLRARDDLTESELRMLGKDLRILGTGRPRTVPDMPLRFGVLAGLTRLWAEVHPNAWDYRMRNPGKTPVGRARPTAKPKARKVLASFAADGKPRTDLSVMRAKVARA